jgi:hypothetical protein
MSTKEERGHIELPQGTLDLQVLRTLLAKKSFRLGRRSYI